MKKSPSETTLLTNATDPATPRKVMSLTPLPSKRPDTSATVTALKANISGLANNHNKLTVDNREIKNVAWNPFLTCEAYNKSNGNGECAHENAERAGDHCNDSKPGDANTPPTFGMDSNEWRRRGKEMVDFIADYLDTIGDRRVTPKVEPGYLKRLLPDSAPFKSESWDQIMQDFESTIMPGVTHWQHPRFHAYFPAGNAYPSVLADMVSDAIGCIGFSWVSTFFLSPVSCGLVVF